MTVRLRTAFAALSIVFLVVTVTLLPYSAYAVDISADPSDTPLSMTILTALLVCLIPTSIGGLLSSIGIAGMDRMIRRT